MPNYLEEWNLIECKDTPHIDFKVFCCGNETVVIES